MCLYPVIACDLYDAIRHLPDLSFKVGFKLEKIKLALVKPNICGLYHPSLDLITSIVKFLSSNAKSVVIGDTRSMLHDPEEQFRRCGIKSLSKRFGGNVRTVDLSSDKRVRVRVSKPHALREIIIPKTVSDSDILVNVPKVGIHSTTSLTCALKNLFGLLPQKNKYKVYHPLGMDKVIADIAQVIKPDLNVVDAGKKAILGSDALAVDVVACRFVSLNPLKVEHLRLVSDDQNKTLEDFMNKLNVTEIKKENTR